ncbi:hypothetical protein HK105_207737 [Polyrhizophydium stewartii]|uniref:Xylanolytic transcriptional activator regulatory domain-containing protein n=1 Tax=Polyrhizophydium stewartii TaxID=2732419 RepID=A0ABR4MZS3_9FUNG
MSTTTEPAHAPPPLPATARAASSDASAGASGAGGPQPAGAAVSAPTERRKPGPRPGHTKALEERLEKLEAIVQALNLDAAQLDALEHQVAAAGGGNGGGGAGLKRRKGSAEERGSDEAAADERQAQLLAAATTVRHDLLGVFEDRMASSLLFVKTRDILAMPCCSPLLLNSIYALTSLFATDAMLLPPFESAAAMSDFYFTQACMFLRDALAAPSASAVLGLLLLMFRCTRIRRGAEGFYYYSLAVRIAMSLNLNKEEAVCRTASVKEREVMRSIWWACYQTDKLISAAHLDSSLIRDEDCRVLLPGTAVSLSASHPQDHWQAHQIAIMSSPDFFVPGLPNQNLHASTVLLQKIYARVVSLVADFKDCSLDPIPADLLYKRSAIEASLRDWLHHAPESFRSLRNLDHAQTVQDPSIAWRGVYLHVMYDSLHVALHRTVMLRNIMASPSLGATSYAARQVLEAAHRAATLLAKALVINPRLDFLPPFISISVFSCALGIVPLLVAGLSPIDVAIAQTDFETFLQALGAMDSCWAIGGMQKHVLLSLHRIQDPVAVSRAAFHLKGLKIKLSTMIGDKMPLPTELIQETLHQLAHNTDAPDYGPDLAAIANSVVEAHKSFVASSSSSHSGSPEAHVDSSAPFPKPILGSPVRQQGLHHQGMGISLSSITGTSAAASAFASQPSSLQAFDISQLANSSVPPPGSAVSAFAAAAAAAAAAALSAPMHPTSFTPPLSMQTGSPAGSTPFGTTGDSPAPHTILLSPSSMPKAQASGMNPQIEQQQQQFQQFQQQRMMQASSQPQPGVAVFYPSLTSVSQPVGNIDLFLGMEAINPDLMENMTMQHFSS